MADKLPQRLNVNNQNRSNTMINPEATEFTLNGVDYIAVDSKPKGSCAGCKIPAGCCDDAPNCTSGLRSDGRDVIFVEAPREKL